MARRTSKPAVSRAKGEAADVGPAQRIKDLYPAVLREIKQLPPPTRDILLALQEVRDADNNLIALDGPRYCDLLGHVGGKVSLKILRQYGLPALAEAAELTGQL